jgi:hypothetical protein
MESTTVENADICLATFPENRYCEIKSKVEKFVGEEANSKNLLPDREILGDKSSTINIENGKDADTFSAMQRAASLIAEHHKHPEKNANELAKQFHLHPKQVYRYFEGKSDLIGKMGRPTFFSPEEEIILARVIGDLAREQKVKISGVFIRSVARGFWRCTHGDNVETPEFCENWLEGFNHRNPQFRLKASYVPAKD